MDKAMSAIDTTHLDKQTMGDKDLARSILQIFADQLSLKLGTLEPGSADFAEQAHSLKGSARGVGAWDVAAAAESLEVMDAPAMRVEGLAHLREVAMAALEEIDTMLVS